MYTFLGNIQKICFKEVFIFKTITAKFDTGDNSQY